MAGTPQTLSGTDRRDRVAIGRTAMALLLLTGTGLGLLFGPAKLGQLAKSGTLAYHEDGFRHLALALTPARLLALKFLLGTATLLGASGWLALRGQKTGVVRQQLWRAATRQQTYWRRLPAGARRSAAVLLTLVAAARLYYLVDWPLSTDEIASFNYFVRRGPCVIASYYPLPNNHLLYNLLAWPLSPTALPPLLVMRLPTWVLGTASLPLTFGLLGRVAGLRRALLATSLLGLAPLQVYYGAVGRGYGLQLVGLQLGFFAALELLRPASGYRQLAWAVLVLSSVAGLLLVPSYAYPLAALLLGLAVGMGQARRWPALGALALAGAAIGLVSLVAYSPLGAVSGWDRLLANRYVTGRPPNQFWPGFRPQLYEVAAELLGPAVRLSGPWWLGTALLGGAISRQMLTGARRRAALMAWLLVALPVGLLAVQRVFPLARVLLYVPWAAGLWLLLSLPRAKVSGNGRQWAMQLGLAGLTALGLYRLYLNETRLLGAQRETRLVRQAYTWLQQAAPAGSQPPTVGLQSPIHELFFAHYQGLAPRRALVMRSYRTPQPSERYDFIVLSRAAVAAGRRVPFCYRAAYSDALVTIYTTPAPFQPPAPTPCLY